MSQIEQWLRSAGLDQYVENFVASGITPAQFVQIPIQEFQQYQVTVLQDKQKLFRLITQLKSQADQPAAGDGRQSMQDIPAGPRILQRQPPQQLGAVQSQPGGQVSGSPRDVVANPQAPAVNMNAERGLVQGRPNQFTNNPTAHPGCPGQIDGRGIPTINRTVIPTDQQFLDIINQKIRVVVRKRPVNNQELGFGYKDIMSSDGWNQISVHEPKVKVDLTRYIEVSTFRFDHVFSEYADNYEVYFYTAKPLINAIFQGKNATCFAYGQTGSGKTWTMMQRETGIYVLAVNDIFHMLHNDPQYSRLRLQVHVSFYEIYGGKLFDLLNNRKILRALEDGKGVVQIFGIFEKQIQSVQDLLNAIDAGLQSRSVGATGANADSSRSHAILQIALKAPNQQTHGKISFIDLAGAERASDVQNTDRQTRMEGAEINMSLLALKECIRAMDKGSAHLPFRDSKLTLVLRDSFIKDSKTVMIACCSPTDKSCENTINTLRYADRVKDLMAAGQARMKVPVIKPSQCVADMILGAANNDQELAQEQYQQHLAQMQRQSVQQQQIPQFGNYVQQPVQPGPQPVVQPPVVQQQAQYQPRAPAVRAVETPTPQEFYQDVVQEPSNAAEGDLARSHCSIVDKIYQLEEDMVKAHRKQVDTMMAAVKEEVTLLHKIDQQEISLDQWVSRLEGILGEKESAIMELRMKIASFKQELQAEQKMSESWKGKK